MLIYSTGTDPIQAVEGDTTPTQKVDVDGTLDDLDVRAVHAVIVPGGTVNADRLRTVERAQSIVKQAIEDGKPLAVICHGPWLLCRPAWRGPHADQLRQPGRRRTQRRRHLGGPGGRRRRLADHQPRPRRPPGLHPGDRGRLGLK